MMTTVTEIMIIVNVNYDYYGTRISMIFIQSDAHYFFIVVSNESLFNLAETISNIKI